MRVIFSWAGRFWCRLRSAGDGGVEAAEGIDGLDGVVGAEGEDDVVVEEGAPGVGVFDALGAEAGFGPVHVGEEVARVAWRR